MKTTIALSFLLGGVTGLFYRDELYFPTNMRIKVAVLEYNLLTRQKINIDLLEIIDPNQSKQLAQKTKRLEDEHAQMIEEK